MSDRAWVEDAACARIDPELWFPITGSLEDAEPAVRICRSCPVQEPCLADAMAWPASRDKDGIFGGLTADERAALRRRRDKRQRATAMAGLRSGWPRPHELDLDRVDDPDYTPIRQET